MLRFLRSRICAVRQVTKPPAGCRLRPLTRCLQQPQTSVRDTIRILLGKGPKHAAGPTVARACSYAIDFTHAHQVWSRALSSSSSPRPGSPKDEEVTSSQELVNTIERMLDKEEAESSRNDENIDGAESFVPASPKDEDVTSSQELVNTVERMLFEMKEEPESRRNDENVDGADSFGMHENVEGRDAKRRRLMDENYEPDSIRNDENVDGAESSVWGEDVEGKDTGIPRSVDENYEFESGSDSDSNQDVMSQSEEMHEEEQPAEEELPQQEEGGAHVWLGEDQEREGVSESSGSGEAMGHGQDDEGYKPDDTDSTSSDTCSTYSVSGSASSDSGSTSSDAGSASSNQQAQFQVEQGQVHQQGMEAVVQEGEEVQQPLAFLNAFFDSGTDSGGYDVSPTSVFDPPGSSSYSDSSETDSGDSSETDSGDSSETDSANGDTDAEIDIMN